MKVGYLTLVFRKDISESAARHIVDELASHAISFESLDGVKCDVGEFDQGDIDAFWNEAGA